MRRRAPAIAVLGRIRTWYPALQHPVRAAHPATILATAVRSSVPVEPGMTGRVTVIGDAIHSMTPARGIGANIGPRDARVLCERLAARSAVTSPAASHS